MRISLYAFAVVFLHAARMNAQDLHFSQFYHNPLHLSPAQTGMFAGDFRATGQYRSQWKSVPVDYRTFGISAELKPRFGKKVKDDAAARPRAWLVALGAQVQRDQAGDGGLSWMQAGLTGSVAHALGAAQAVSVGFGVALAQRSVDLGALKFRQQWNGEVFDPARPTGESFEQSSGLTPTASVGLAWHYQPAGSRARAAIGAGLFHVNRPAIGFRDDLPFKLPNRLALHADGRLPLGQRLDVVAFALGQRMGTAQEVVAGGGLRLLLNSTPGRNTAVQASLAARLGDALIPAVQLEYEAWTVGLSYDLNTSRFEQATSGRGGPELAVVYRPLPVPPLKTFKACPIF
jgi:type IX secretion system PorP/SprF family membrane protein